MSDDNRILLLDWGRLGPGEPSSTSEGGSQPISPSTSRPLSPPASDYFGPSAPDPMSILLFHKTKSPRRQREVPRPYSPPAEDYVGKAKLKPETLSPSELIPEDQAFKGATGGIFKSITISEALSPSNRSRANSPSNTQQDDMFSIEPGSPIPKFGKEPQSAASPQQALLGLSGIQGQSMFAASMRSMFGKPIRGESSTRLSNDRGASIAEGSIRRFSGEGMRNDGSLSPVRSSKSTRLIFNAETGEEEMEVEEELDPLSLVQDTGVQNRQKTMALGRSERRLLQRENEINKRIEERMARIEKQKSVQRLPSHFSEESADGSEVAEPHEGVTEGEKHGPGSMLGAQHQTSVSQLPASRSPSRPVSPGNRSISVNLPDIPTMEADSEAQPASPALAKQTAPKPELVEATAREIPVNQLSQVLKPQPRMAELSILDNTIESLQSLMTEEFHKTRKSEDPELDPVVAHSSCSVAPGFFDQSRRQASTFEAVEQRRTSEALENPILNPSATLRTRPVSAHPERLKIKGSGIFSWGSGYKVKQKSKEAVKAEELRIQALTDPQFPDGSREAEESLDPQPRNQSPRSQIHDLMLSEGTLRHSLDRLNFSTPILPAAETNDSVSLPFDAMATELIADDRGPRPIKWRERLAIGAVVVQSNYRQHLSRVELRKRQFEEEERKQRELELEHERLMTAGTIGAIKAGSHIKKEVRELRQRKSQKEKKKDFNPMEIVEQVRLDAAVALIQRNIMLAVKKIAEYRHTIDYCWPNLPDWIKSDIDRIDQFGIDEAKMETVEEMGLEWTNADEDFFAAYSGNPENPGTYIRIWSMIGVERTVKGEDARKLAKAVGLFIQKLGSNLRDRKGMPDLSLAAKWVRLNRYNVVKALKSYSKLLELQEKMKKGEMPAPWKQTDLLLREEIKEVERKGLYWVRAQRLSSAHFVDESYHVADPEGGAIAVMHLHLLCTNCRDTSQTERLGYILYTFINSLMEEVPEAQLYGVTLVVNITESGNDNFSYSLIQEIKDQICDLFPCLLNNIVIYGPRHRLITGWVTAGKLVLPSICRKISYMDALDCANFSLERMCFHLGVKNQNPVVSSHCGEKDLPKSEAENPLASSGGFGVLLRAKSVAKQLFARVQSAKDMSVDFDADEQKARRRSSVYRRRSSVAYSTTSNEDPQQVVELEENNVAQQAMLVKDGWYGSYDVDTATHYVEGGQDFLQHFKKKPPGQDERKLYGHIHPGEVPSFVAGVKTGMARGRTMAAQAIARACAGRRFDNKQVISDHHAVVFLTEMVANGETPEEKRAAAQALAMCCDRSVDNAEEAQRSAAVLPCLSLLTCGEQAARTAAALAIAKICSGSELACEDVANQNGIPKLIHSVQIGSETLRASALLAIASVCHLRDEGRLQFAKNGGTDMLIDILSKGSIAVQSAAAQVVSGLFQTHDDRHGVCRHFRQRHGMTLLTELLRSGSKQAERDASSAIALSIRADENCAVALNRVGATSALINVLIDAAPINKVMYTLKPNQEGMLSSDDFRRVAKKRLIGEESIDEYLKFLDPENDGFVTLEDWFRAQQNAVEALTLMAQSRLGAEDTASDLLRLDGLNQILPLALDPRPISLQRVALRAVATLCRLEEQHAREFSQGLMDAGAARKFLKVIKDGHPEAKPGACQAIYDASKANIRFRQVADQAGTVTIVRSFMLKEGSEGEARAAAEPLINLFMAEESGLLYTIQTGDSSAQEKAAAALWNMSANRHKLRGSLMRNPMDPGILENVAFSGATVGSAMTGGLNKHDNTEDLAHQTHSIQGRRLAMNALKVLGRIPPEQEVPKPRPKLRALKKVSQLRAFLDYKTKSPGELAKQIAPKLPGSYNVMN